MAQEPPHDAPLAHRAPSIITLGVVGFLCRSFLYGLNRTKTHGLEDFLRLLDERRDESGRERGLITVSNHVSVLDDPLIWGVLPFAYHWRPTNMRWSLGSYDICFKNGQSSLLSRFFTYGQTLPTLRLAHSPHGGLFQPTITECIRLLSNPHGPPSSPLASEASSSVSFPESDPFSSPHFTYSPTPTTHFPSPSSFPSNRYAWLHIFPEGMIHQHPAKQMRYFKWGVARLILETEPCPDVVPMWIDGPQEVMSEKRESPRWVPRAGREVNVTFGGRVDVEGVFGGFRERWREMVERERSKATKTGGDKSRVAELGVVESDELRYGAEAEALRIEVTMAVRREVLKVRASRGLVDEDPKSGLAETYRREGPKREGVMGDGSLIRDT